MGEEGMRERSGCRTGGQGGRGRGRCVRRGGQVQGRGGRWVGAGRAGSAVQPRTRRLCSATLCPATPGTVAHLGRLVWRESGGLLLLLGARGRRREHRPAVGGGRHAQPGGARHPARVCPAPIGQILAAWLLCGRQRVADAPLPAVWISQHALVRAVVPAAGRPNGRRVAPRKGGDPQRWRACGARCRQAEGREGGW